MLLGIDHLAIAVDDPDAAISELASYLGIPAGTSGGRHLAWGTRNRLLWLRDTYIELCTVFDPSLAERSWLGRAVLRARGTLDPTAICWAIATDDLDLDRAGMNLEGATLGEALPGERRRPDGQIVRWRLALPADVALERPFLIEHDPAAAEWSPEDRAARSIEPARVLGIELPIDSIVGLPAAVDEHALGTQWVRAAGGATGSVAIRIGGLARGAAEAEVLGCRWLLE
jgi:hypothetical protein